MTTTITDTIRELRELPLGKLEDATVQNLQTAFTFLPMLLDAADENASRSKENSMLRAERDMLREKAERYEKALRVIAGVDEIPPEYLGYISLVDTVDIAEKALAPEQGEQS